MSTATHATTDELLRVEVQKALMWVPALHAASIGVGVKNGVVTLSGNVSHLELRHEAARAALRVRGVRALANDIEVVLAEEAPDDAEIAQEIAHQLGWMASVPEGAVTAEVEHGVVTLRGTVDHDAQRRVVERQARAVRGVRWVTDYIGLSSRASSADTKERIVEALLRNAALDAQGINVTSDGTRVTLSGEVGSWDEKHQAELTAWGSPNVTRVENNLVVAPR